MSGRHRRPEADALPGVDVAAQMDSGPVVPVTRVEPAPVATVVPGATTGGGSRTARAVARAAERERRAETRRRLGLVGAVVLVLGALVAAGVVLLSGGGDEAPTRTASPQQARQDTLLLQVTGPDGAAAASALVGVTPAESTGSVVLVPSGLLVDVAGSGSLPFGETVTLPEESAPAQALTDLVGVRIDESWVLSSGGLARLVDSVGGVRVAVDVDVLAPDGAGGQTVVVQAGSQELAGDAAAAYATYLAEGETELARLARFDDVLSAVLEGLPGDAGELRTRLEALGADSRSTLAPEDLGQRLADLQAVVAEDALVTDVLPVTEYDAGGGTPTYGVEPGQLEETMQARFPGARQTALDGQVVEVLVSNGVGTPGLVEQARTRLVDAGFRFRNGGNAQSFTDEPSSVILPDGTAESVAAGRRVAEVLGLPATSLETTDRGQNLVDVIVILGTDFAN